MIPEEYEYSDPGLSSRVNDFGDEYHLPDDDEANQEKSILKDVKRLKRRYRNFGEYCEAMRLYQNYCNDLIDKYGGKKRFRFALAIGMVKEYIPFKPEIRNDKRNKPYIKGGEIWLVDAINLLKKEGFPLYTVVVENGKYYDTGNKIEYMKTVVEMALHHKDINGEFRKFLHSLNL
jgi:hypothetical protein